jgi:hypothetical protein
MFAKAFVPILLVVSTLSHAEQNSNIKTCDSMATFAVSAVQAKNSGVDFITFAKKLDEVDAPVEAKAAMKFIAAKAYSSATQEEAYSSTYMECMTSLAK